MQASVYLNVVMKHCYDMEEFNALLAHNNAWIMEELSVRVHQVQDLQNHLDWAEMRFDEIVCDLMFEVDAHAKTTSRLVAAEVVRDVINTVVAKVVARVPDPATNSIHLTKMIVKKDAALARIRDHQGALVARLNEVEEINDTTGVLLAVALSERDAALRERNAAVSERDAAVAEVAGASHNQTLLMTSVYELRDQVKEMGNHIRTLEKQVKKGEAKHLRVADEYRHKITSMSHDLVAYASTIGKK